VVKEVPPVEVFDNAIFMVIGCIVAMLVIILCGAGNYIFRKSKGRIRMEDEEIGLNDVKLEEIPENGHTNGHTNGHANGHTNGKK
jgi:hypothetical protein